ncbi:hypothetical protein GXW83_19560 [Streptacidiphilus sp. PB12-B1b]|uniref:hypothetical protein n=1 Tax=Streptacidiphilus sp. PB12-B1b TaxID=2705012 RepID=UPI0015FD954E|nr:hypothetical protein [Streptacidiphilus sp. PB12-B1b]QMU77562.1 hypothetical protein GXW83_19560 [Streptacidiphilus sp. PB12-B1b]
MAALTQQQVRVRVAEILGDSVHVDVEQFPSGTMSVTLDTGTRTAVLDGHPDSGWGWTVDAGEDDGFSGHQNTSPTLDAALDGIRETLRS